MPKLKRESKKSALEKLSIILGKIENSQNYLSLKNQEISSLLKGQKSFGLLDEIRLERLVFLAKKKPSILLSSLTIPELTRLGKALEKASKKKIAAAKAKKLELIGGEAEAKLRDVLTQVKSAPFFPVIAGRTLGEYWDDNEDRSPFEEAFTIKQLADFDLNILFRKRTMNSNKVCLMIQALENVLLGTAVA